MISTQQNLKIGSLDLWPNVILSPMHGVTDQAFRLLCKRLAAGRLGLLVSEFVAVEGIDVKNPKELKLMDHSDEEKPFAVQIFGSDVELMGRAASYVQDRGIDVLEINAGCPAPKVVKRGGGSGLLRDLSLLRRILANCRQRIQIPLSLKVRLGWSEEEINLFEVLNIAQGEGVDLLVVHGRTRLQGYKGFANWDLIAQAKSRATIPVVGNGDCKSVEEIGRFIYEYGVDGVSIGRGAMHNPWIFGQIADAYQGIAFKKPDGQDLIEVFYQYCQLLDRDIYEGHLLGRLKQIAARVSKAFSGTDSLRLELLRSQNVEQFWRILELTRKRLLQGEIVLDYVPFALQSLNGKHQSEVEEGYDYHR